MSTDVATTPPPRAPRRRGDGWVARTVRGLGWLFIAAGTLVLLFLVYLLWFTNVRASQAQQEVLDQFVLEYGDPTTATAAGDTDTVDDTPVEIGDAWGAITFARNGQRILHDDPLYVVEGVDLGSLTQGPGHYPSTAQPGQVGNVGIAGHRTTNLGPFGDLDQLQAGDVVTVTDRNLRQWDYVVRDSNVGQPLAEDAAGIIVRPSDAWVVDPDPQGTGGAWLTLTTCHPRFSNAQRLIVFAELVGDPLGTAEQDGVDELPGEGDDGGP